jgi:hypothetical protein
MNQSNNDRMCAYNDHSSLVPPSRDSLKLGDNRVVRRNNPHSTDLLARSKNTKATAGSTFDPLSKKILCGKQLEGCVMKHDKRIGRAPRLCLIDLSLAGFSSRTDKHTTKPTLFSRRSRTLLDDISTSGSQVTQESLSNRSGTSDWLGAHSTHSRKVRFNPVGVYEFPTLSRSNMTKEEVSAYWYSSDEKACCKQQAHKIANSFISDKITNRKMEDSSFTAKTIKSSYHALKKISRNVHVENEIGDTVTSMTVLDDIFQNLHHATSAPECQQMIQLAHDALQRWFHEVSHFHYHDNEDYYVNNKSSLDDETVLGLERFVTKKIERDSSPIRKSVVEHYRHLKMKPSTQDKKDESCVDDVLAQFSQEQSLPHRLFSRFLGDIIHLETIENQ